MGKASVKTTGKVLAQSAARKSAGKGAAMAAAVDLAMLAAQERLTRADMRRELLATLEETLQLCRPMFGCR